MTPSHRFVHLHVHSTYSFLDGYCPANKVAARAKELGMEALAVTDHNHLGGCLVFQEACNKVGIKPLLGLEGYYTWDTDIASLPVETRNDMATSMARLDGHLPEEPKPEINARTGKPKKPKKLKKSEIKDIIAPYEYDMKQYHILLLALNQTGWHNLVRLQSEAAEKCTYNGRFLMDDKLLEKYNEGILMTTACISNAAAHLIIKEDPEKAKAQILKWHAIFKDRFRLEIQPLNIDKQWQVNFAYMKLAAETGIKVVATNDVHWTNYEDYDDHDTYICVGTGKYKDQIDRMQYSNDFWLKSYEEMVESFETQTTSMQEYFGDDFPAQQYRDFWYQAMQNTNEIAPIVEPVELGSPVPLFPKVELPEGIDPSTRLGAMCGESLYKYLAKNPELPVSKYEHRLNTELFVISKKGFSPYIITVEEFVRHAKNNGCPTGPGRGSAAGALINFLLGITKIDPLKYDLLFSRFLTMDRSEPPDIDVDFCYNNRHKVIEHLEEKYGKANVAHIGTYTVMGVKSGLKDVGRVFRVDFDVMNAISKKLDEINDKPQPEFKDFDNLKDSDRAADRQKWTEFNALEEKHTELFRIARAFEGNPRNAGVHASGILVTPEPIADLFPTRKDGKTGSIVTLYTGKQLDKLGAIKFDILGLKTISVINQTLASIDPDLNFENFCDELDINDPEVYAMICDRQTDGLFQIESPMFKGIIGNIQPKNLEEISAITALGRPGPLQAGMDKDYFECKQGIKEISEPLPDTLSIVEETYGNILYQEQFMLFVVKVSGFNLNQSDSIARKIVGKKEREKMEMLRRMIVFGKVNVQGPEGWESMPDHPWYDLAAKYGDEIKGGVNNGYTVDQMNGFWNMIQGFIDYCFNKSHAVAYSLITVMTAVLKKHFPIEFMASLLTLEDNEEKRDKYIKIAELMGINVLKPDINLSGIGFTPTNNGILYGLGSIKGIGDTSIPTIIANRPYLNIEEAYEKIGKKAFNKTAGINLIKAGAFDYLGDNRHRLINSFLHIRGEKEGYLDEQQYGEECCIAMENQVLGTSITFKPWYENIRAGEKIARCEASLIKLSEKVDKNNNLMAFVELMSAGSKIKGIIFSSNYRKIMHRLNSGQLTYLFSGKKDDKGTFIINEVLEKPNEDPNNQFVPASFSMLSKVS